MKDEKRFQYVYVSYSLSPCGCLWAL